MTDEKNDEDRAADGGDEGFLTPADEYHADPSKHFLRPHARLLFPVVGAAALAFLLTLAGAMAGAESPPKPLAVVALCLLAGSVSTLAVTMFHAETRYPRRFRELLSLGIIVEGTIGIWLAIVGVVCSLWSIHWSAGVAFLAFPLAVQAAIAFLDAMGRRRSR